MPNSTAPGEPAWTIQLVDGTIPGTADLIARPFSAPRPLLGSDDALPLTRAWT